MKKSILLIAAVALGFAACSDVDTLKKDIQVTDGMAISFSTFSEKLTRGATENSDTTYSWVFYNHHNDFQVWSYKNTSTEKVFDGDSVTVTKKNANSTVTYVYEYSPLRYWDKAAEKYEFYAAAPKDKDGWEFVAPTQEDQKNGYFKTSSELTGTNLAWTPATEYAQSFKDSADVDKMIAAPTTVLYANFNKPVQLNFIHILSRLNVTIKKDTVLSKQIVKIEKFEVKNLLSEGDFDENTTVANLAKGSNDRWTPGSNKVTYAATTATDTAKLFKVQEDPYYIIESLVIPQDAELENIALDGKARTVETTTYTAIESATKPYFVITYQIWDGDTKHKPEKFTAYYNLATVFSGDTPAKLEFNEGWQNTLNLTIKPSTIDFTAEVAAWADNEVTAADVN